MRARLADVDSGPVDLALFCLSLEHVDDLGGPLREAARIVKPGASRSWRSIRFYR